MRKETFELIIATCIIIIIMATLFSFSYKGAKDTCAAIASKGKVKTQTTVFSGCLVKSPKNGGWIVANDYLRDETYFNSFIK